MFKVETLESLLWPVEVNVPRDDGSGESDTHQIKVRYRYLTTDEYEAATAKVMSMGGDVDYREFVLDWEDVTGADDKPLTFSKANLKRLMSHRWLASAINYGFRDCQDAGVVLKN